MIPIMNGHNHALAPSQPDPTVPAILWESAARNPWSATLLLVLGLNYCGPLAKQVAASVAQITQRCPDPVRTVEATKECSPPCPTGQTCHKGDCVKVAADRQMTLASQPDEPTRVILEIRATTR